MPDFGKTFPALFRDFIKINTWLFFFVLIIIYPAIADAQWVNNPAENTRVVYDLANPINISVVGDHNGGAFIFWQDNVTGIQNEISYMHIESNGNISFRADGKKVSVTTGDQDNPVSVSAGKNAAVVAWKDFSNNKSGDLLVQKVQASGNILWNSKGIKINKLNREISDYSLSSNGAGEIFVSWLAKEQGQEFNPTVLLLKLSIDGRCIYDSLGISVSGSANNKMNPCVISDDSSGAYIFWIETSGGKGKILSRHFDKTGKPMWGKTPLNITDNSLNVISFTAEKSLGDIYLAYQVLQNGKSIYHQLMSYSGKLLWGKNGRLCTIKEGNQSNPQMIAGNESLILTWTNEINNDRDIYIQKYNRNGKPVWQSGGAPVIKLSGDQFGQKIISDDYKGAIVAWLDRRTASAMGNIYSQRITSEGKIYWDSEGIAIGSYFNTPKSYLNLIPDGRGSAISVFKERRNSENGIYVQKIFNTGTFVSQIIGLKTEVTSDSVKIAWYSANEFPHSIYNIERSVQTDTGNTDWVTVTSLTADSGKSANYYQYFDKPDTSGTLYYRIILDENQGNMQSSEISRVTFLESANYIIVTQNDPNPFSDSTLIKFYLPEQANVKIEFFNNHIEKINEVNNIFPSGENSISFIAGNKQPGIYFYKFTSGDFVEVKKMVLTN